MKRSKVSVGALFVSIIFSFCLTAFSQNSYPISPESVTWKYTAMGDSLAVGYPNDFRGGYVVNYRDYIQIDTGNTVVLNNLGVNGWTSSQLLNALRTDSNFRNSINSSQFVTFDIGGNDLAGALDKFSKGMCGGADNQDCLRSAVAQFKANWSAIINEILALRGTTNAVIRTMDIYNPYVGQLKAAGVLPLLKRYLDDVDNYIATTSQANSIPCARVYQAFNGVNGDEEANDKGYLAFDHFHPSEAGYRVISDLFRSAGYAPLIGATNSIDDPQFFVRHHYLDFLNRDPDQDGLNFWTNQITSCGSDARCIDIKRQNVSAAYFLSFEFQQTGYFAYQIYRVAYKRIPRYQEFLEDSQILGKGVVGGSPDAGSTLTANKASYIKAFVERAAFKLRYPDSLTFEQFVDALIADTGNNSLPSMRDAYLSRLKNGESRASIVQDAAQNGVSFRSEFNKAFVLMQYFGYLRRNPDDPPDNNWDGYNFWLKKLNDFNGDYIKSEMVRSFILSGEYRKRFGQL